VGGLQKNKKAKYNLDQLSTQDCLSVEAKNTRKN